MGGEENIMNNKKKYRSGAPKISLFNLIVPVCFLVKKSMTGCSIGPRGTADLKSDLKQEYR